jgi:hypothetical protein
VTWLAPLGLLGLLALPVILLLHLVRQRRRAVRVPSLELWTMAAAPVQRKPRRLPLTLLLLLHLLVALLLALSLGRPLLPGGAFAPTNTIILLDTSTSMAATDGGLTGATTRFEAAQAAARQLLGAARKGDRIGVVTLGTTPRLLGRGGPEAADSLIGAVAELRPAGADGDLLAAINLASAAAEPEDGVALPARYVVLTDPAYGAQGAPTQPITATGDLDWRVFGGPADNAAIVALAARPLRDGGQQLYARVANFGTGPAVRTLQVLLDGAVVESEALRLEAGAEAEWSWPIPRGVRLAEARLSGGDAAPADDHASAVLSGGTSRRVQLVSALPTPLERALKAQPGLEVVLSTPESYRPDPDAGLAVFVDYVPAALPAMPTWLVAPPRGSGLVTETGRLGDLQVDRAQDPRFAGLDLRSVRIARASVVDSPRWASVLLASRPDDGRPGTPLVLSGVLDGQPRTVWTFDPAHSNLAGRLAFPLLASATLRTLLPHDSSALRLGQPAPEAMVTPDGSSIAAGTVLTEPGLYQWSEQEGTVAVNAVDPAESDLRPRTRPAVESAGAGASTLLQEAGSELWRPLLIAVLVLLPLEWLYAHRRRFARPNTAPPAGRAQRPA